MNYESRTLMISESAAHGLAFHCWSPNSFQYAVSSNAKRVGSSGKSTIWNWAKLACPINQQHMGRDKGISIELLVSVLLTYSSSVVGFKVTTVQPWLSGHVGTYLDKQFVRIWELYLNTASSVGFIHCYNVCTHCCCICNKLSFI